MEQMNFDFLKTAIQSKAVFCYDPNPSQEALHIAYGVDDSFVRPMGVAMTSILENNPAEKMVFHVLTEYISEAEKTRLEALARQYRTTVWIYHINGKIFDQLPSTAHFTKATYNRFLLPKALDGQVERVVYLDADILCLGEISALKSVDFKGLPVCVVEDIPALVKRQVKSLQMKQNRYFNAGFLYIDVQLWNQMGVSEQALRVSFERIGTLDWLDQDALNLVLEGKAQYLEKKYDYIFDLGANADIEALPGSTVFVHYAGRFKPWHSWCLHPLKRDFLRYAAISPWKDVPLVQPGSYKDIKKMAKSYQTFGHWGKAAEWYGKYAYHKLKKLLCKQN